MPYLYVYRAPFGEWSGKVLDEIAGIGGCESPKDVLEAASEQFPDITDLLGLAHFVALSREFRAVGMGTATSIKLDDDLKGRVQHLADTRRRSSHWIMREAIAQYVDREEKRQAFYQDALRAWEEYQETGLHATGDEVDRWLASWGTDHELPAPECHK